MSSVILLKNLLLKRRASTREVFRELLRAALVRLYDISRYHLFQKLKAYGFVSNYVIFISYIFIFLPYKTF
jgi:hypothetical protein